MLAFSLMAFSACLGWPRGRGRLAVIAAALVLLGVFIEVVQSFVPGRSADAADVLADAVGIGIGLLVAQAWQRLRKPA